LFVLLLLATDVARGTIRAIALLFEAASMVHLFWALSRKGSVF
jgi:hypothetical protein